MGQRYVHVRAAHIRTQGMHREYFSLEVKNVDWVDNEDDPDQPAFKVEFDDGRERLLELFSGSNGDLLDADEIDFTYRLQSGVDDPDAHGVVALTDRLTGDYVCELNAPASDVLPFVSAARRYCEKVGDDARYVVTFIVDDEELIEYEKQTFLVYGPDGDLLRKHSLIPSGVEI